MSSEMIVKITMAVITICGALISAYVVPFIQTKIGTEKLETLSYYISVAVRCAEQIYTVEEYKLKKDYVMRFAQGILKDKLHISLTTEQLDTIVEGIVNEIKH